MKPGITIGEKYGPAMLITDQAEADAYFEECMQHAMRNGRLRERAEKIERSNLGYFAGYSDHETRARVERLFRCAHPVFGSIAEHGVPSPEAAFAAGQRLALKELTRTYEIRAADCSITCKRCGRTSHNPNDVAERYCGHCQAFHEDT